MVRTRAYKEIKAAKNNMIMKTDLDHLPEAKQRELKRILDILFEEFENAFVTSLSDWKRQGQIRGVILFGSYARGDWVDERHSGKGYQSDYDLLIIVSHEKLTDYYELWGPLWERLFRDSQIKTPVTFIVHTLDQINQELSLGRYFYVDIRKQGIVLHETPNCRLKEPQPLSVQDALDLAEEYAEEWIESADSALMLSRYAMEKDKLKDAAFLLHQSTERIYNAFLLTLTNYSPATHNLNALRSLSEDRDKRLIDAWPRETKADKKPFNKLVDAYVKARYSKHYKIDKETLVWLIARVEHLHQLVETACKERIEELKKQVQAEK